MLGSRRIVSQLDATSDPEKQRTVLRRYFHHLMRHYHKGLISRHELVAAIAGFSQVPALKLSGPTDAYAEVIYLAMQLELPPHYRRTDTSWDEFEEKVALLKT